MRVTFILADTLGTRIALTHENEWIPYKRRSVTIELTPEQVAQVTPQKVGEWERKPVLEEIVTCFLENEPGAQS
jgi:hypothetical protein